MFGVDPTPLVGAVYHGHLKLHPIPFKRQKGLPVL
jgi:hypothetical protein